MLCGGGVVFLVWCLYVGCCVVVCGSLCDWCYFCW